MHRFFITAAVGLVLSGMSGAPALAGDGAKLYNKRCAICHGKDGTANNKMGKGSANFNDREWQAKTSIDDVIRVTSEGVPDTKMRAFNVKLSAEEIRAIAEYVKTL